ncbi:MAG: transposase, partial [Thermodesulfobacteriota bacterium]
MNNSARADKNCYTCPEGHTLRHASTEKKSEKRWHQIIDKELCFSCQHWEECTKGKSGQRIVRLPDETIREKLEAHYKEEASQEIYARRKASAA